MNMLNDDVGLDKSKIIDPTNVDHVTAYLKEWGTHSTFQTLNLRQDYQETENSLHSVFLDKYGNEQAILISYSLDLLLPAPFSDINK